MRETIGMCFLLTACGSTGVVEIVEPGKADGYYSDVAREIEVSGLAPMRFTGAAPDDPGARALQIERRVTAVGLYLTAYLGDKLPGLFRNDRYGGFQAMVRNRSGRTTLRGDAENGYAVAFTFDVAGPRSLASAFPLDLHMPRDAAVDPAAVPRGVLRSFDPATYPGPLEVVRLHARPAPAGANAYPRFREFVVDGVYDLTVFFGWDYHAERWDLVAAREAFAALGALGFTAPVSSFEELRAGSGPFWRAARSQGRPTRIEVRLFHSDMFRGERARQRRLALAEMGRRDVFVYHGHAGPYAGLILGPSGRASIDPAELAGVPLRRAPQVFVAQGCQTYSQYADMLYANPAKDERNLDVLTTVSFGYGRGTPALLERLTDADEAGNHRPADFRTILRDLNGDPVNEAMGVLYGVLGVDDNPRLHPYAAAVAIGSACLEAADCGDASGNYCVRHGDGARRCGAAALAESACPRGTWFRQLAVGRTIVGAACLAAPR
jgi:hypothetical protein